MMAAHASYTVTHLVFAAISAASFVSFLLSPYLVFKSDAAATRRLLWTLKVASVLVWAICMTSILRTNEIAPGQAFGCCVLQLGALALYWWAVHTAKHDTLTVAFNPRASVRLLSTGPFCFLLHPFYTSYVLSYLSVCLFTYNDLTAAATLFMYGVYYKASGLEEAVLGEHFGAQYVYAMQHRASLFFRLNRRSRQPDVHEQNVDAP